MRNRNISEKYIREMRILKPEYEGYRKHRFGYFQDYIFIPFIDDRDN